MSLALQHHPALAILAIACLLLAIVSFAAGILAYAITTYRADLEPVDVD